MIKSDSKTAMRFGIFDLEIGIYLGFGVWDLEFTQWDLGFAGTDPGFTK
jgi:hypothetical protein